MPLLIGIEESLMSYSLKIAGAVCCLAMAFGAGVSWQQAAVPRIAAQDEQFEAPSDDTVKKIVVAYDSLRAAMEGLKQEQKYVPATKSLNPYGVIVGGLDVVADLESGRGVDPYTFAALYAGDATDEIATHLTKDDEGRLMYKNRVIRMYPISRFKKLEGQRISLTSGKGATTDAAPSN